MITDVAAEGSRCNRRGLAFYQKGTCLRRPGGDVAAGGEGVRALEEGHLDETIVDKGADSPKKYETLSSPALDVRLMTALQVLQVLISYRLQLILPNGILEETYRNFKS